MISPAAEFKFSVVEDTDQSFRTEWPVPADLPYFDGHFPGFPVLPAVAIVDATVELIRKGLGLEELRVSRIVSAKFMSPVTPGSKVEISVQRSPGSDWKAEWRASGKLMADLRLHF